MKGKSNTLLTTSMKGEVITDDSLNEIEDVIGQVNLHSQNLQEVIGALAFDYDAFGNCFAEIVRGKVGSQPFHLHLPRSRLQYWHQESRGGSDYSFYWHL
jgi:hypothetical protein